MVAWHFAALPLPLTHFLPQSILETLCELLPGAHRGQASVGQQYLHVLWLQVLQYCGDAGRAVHCHTLPS